jgi:hypothetical protein
MLSGGKRNSFDLLLFYVLTFLLLWEWLRPLQYFTDTGHTVFFILFIALVFLLTFFKVPWFIRFPVSLGFVLFALHIDFLRRIGVFTFMDCPAFSGFKSKFLLYFLRHVAGYVAVVSDAALLRPSLAACILAALLGDLSAQNFILFYHDRCLHRGDR